MAKARLIVVLPPERIDCTTGDGSAPQIGDVVELDHGMTSSDGRSGGIVVCVGANGEIKWIADVLDSEIEVLPPDVTCR